MKKIISLFIILCLSISFVSFAETLDNGFEVSLTEFSYKGENGEEIRDLSLAGNEITAGGNLQSIEYAENMEYIFFIMVTKNGKYFSSDYESGVLNGTEIIPVSVTAALPLDKDGVRVETFVWDSLKGSKALTSKSVFGSSENELLYVFSDGVIIENFSGDNTEAEITYPASLSHTPRIQAVARDSGAKIEIDDITSFPQIVNIKVTSQSGVLKTYKLKVDLHDGEISNAYLLDKDGVRHPVKKDTLRRPDYGNNLKPGDDGFDLITAVPETSTNVYSDRTNLYYYDIPDNLLGKTVLQLPRQVLAYDDKHLDKNNAKAVMGGFDLNRSANVYVYGVKEDNDWMISEGYVRADDSFKLSRTQNTAAAYFPEVFVKTYIVNEGESVTVNLGNATSSSGYNSSYHLMVDFLTPVEIAGIKNVSIENEDEFSFNPMINEYDVDLFGDHDSVPEINYEIFGAGATAVYEPASSLPGTSKITVTSKDGKFTKVYKFNLHAFENVLKSIKIDGVPLEGFDKNIYDYTFKLPYGDNEVREITAEANESINVEITQATDENKTAIITLTDMNNNVVTYTVCFELTLERPSVQKTLACSWTGILSDGFSIDPLTNVSNPSDDHILHGVAKNHSVVATNISTYRNSILYNRIDLTKLANIAEGKPVYYNLYTQFGSDNISNVTTDIEMYLADDSIWSIFNGNDKLSSVAKATDIEGLISRPLIGKNEITQSGGYWTATSAFYQFDITDVVNEALLQNKTHITIGIRLVPVESSSSYIMRLRVWQNSSTQSNVSYYSYE